MALHEALWQRLAKVYQMYVARTRHARVASGYRPLSVLLGLFASYMCGVRHESSVN